MNSYANNITCDAKLHIYTFLENQLYLRNYSKKSLESLNITTLC